MYLNRYGLVDADLLSLIVEITESPLKALGGKGFIESEAFGGNIPTFPKKCAR